MARKAKPARPTPGELRREQPRTIRDLLIDPRLRAQLEEVKRATEVARNWLSPERREFLRLWHEQQREALRYLRVRTDDEPPLPPSPPPMREKTRRGRPVKLTHDEIATGVTIVRRENAEYQKRFGRQLKQTEAFRALRQLKVTRDGKLLTISPATWRRWVVKRALDSE